MIKILKNIYKKAKINRGINTRLNGFIYIKNPKNIFIGPNSYVNSNTYLFAGKNSKILIGADCLISYNVHIRTDSHMFKKRDVLIRKQGHIEKNIRIEDDVWIGFGAQILSGVTIHKGAVVGAGSIVTKDVEEYAVVAGVPAKKIGTRS